MTMRLMQIVLAMSLLLNMFVLAGFVYRSWIAPPPTELAAKRSPAPHSAGLPPSLVEGMARELGLDDGQRAALLAVFEKAAADRRRRVRDIQQVRDEAAAELRKPEVDLARIDGLVDKVSRLRGEQQRENLRAVLQFEPQLTPQQRERLRSVLADRMVGPSPRPPGGLGSAGPRPAPPQ